MNAVFNFSRLVRISGVIAVFSVLSACGQRGPLYLPKPLMTPAPAKPVTPPVDSTATPAPQKPDSTPDSTQNNLPK